MDGLSKPFIWCPSLTGAMIRHVAKNCDIDCPEHDRNGKSAECPGAFGRYDGEFIAAAPTDVADLLAEVERLTAQIARVEALIVYFSRDWRDMGFGDDRVIAYRDLQAALGEEQPNG